MSEKPTILDDLAAQEADFLEQAAKVRRKREEIARIAAQAAEYGLILAPAAAAARAEIETVSDLINSYKTDVRSPYHALKHSSRAHYDALLSLIGNGYGKERLASLDRPDFVRWHENWSAGGKVAIAHSKLGMVRNLCGFGTEVLQNDQCQRLSGILSKMRVAAPKARTERLTTYQALLIRMKAAELKRPSIALAQAFQTDCNLLQKDVIGEWVPVAAAGVSEITSGGMKWVRGLRWNEIDDKLILKRPSQSWQGEIEVDLRFSPSIRDELRSSFGFDFEKSTRDDLPKSGPIIVSENDGLPWDAVEFRRWWRRVADACNIPKTVRNSDSRSRAKEDKPPQAENDEERLAK